MATAAYKQLLTCGTRRIDYNDARTRAMDARRKRNQAKPKTSRIEREYARSLAKVGEHIGTLISHFPTLEEASSPELMGLLEAYSQTLRPWAERTSQAMIEQVNQADEQTWQLLANKMSRQLRRDIAETPVGSVIARLMGEQTELITSLPTDAAQRVQRITVEGLLNGERYAELATQLEESGEVSKSRAVLIARTEVSRTATNLMQARSAQAGSTHYIWRTSRDATVRPGHAEMEGQVCEWANPPEVREGKKLMHFHPGTIWNCRCYPEPIIP